MKDKEIIENFYNLVQRNIIKNKLEVGSNNVTSNSFFIGENARDSRLDYNITTDIKNIQQDLIYLTGVLFALYPYINNPTKETMHFMGKQRTTYFQNMYDSLYSMYASICFEKLYNFWDRIGDKIAIEFPEIFSNPRAIMFANVIEKIKNNSSNKNLNWLINFKETDFKIFNKKGKSLSTMPILKHPIKN